VAGFVSTLSIGTTYVLSIVVGNNKFFLVEGLMQRLDPMGRKRRSLFQQGTIALDTASSIPASSHAFAALPARTLFCNRAEMYLYIRTNIANAAQIYGSCFFM
jgi:hypothetical protein